MTDYNRIAQQIVRPTMKKSLIPFLKPKEKKNKFSFKFCLIVCKAKLHFFYKQIRLAPIKFFVFLGQQCYKAANKLSNILIKKETYKNKIRGVNER